MQCHPWANGAMKGSEDQVVFLEVAIAVTSTMTNNNLERACFSLWFHILREVRAGADAETVEECLFTRACSACFLIELTVCLSSDCPRWWLRLGLQRGLLLLQEN